MITDLAASTPVRIGVAAVFESARWSFWQDKAALVPASYHGAIVRAGAIDMPLVPDARVGFDPDLVLDVIDGLLLIGGIDVDPSCYGGDADSRVESTDAERDAFEIALARRALERGMPVLGICRGMQILNVALDGSLVCDLGPELNAVHRPRLGSFDGTQHDIEVASGSLAASVCGSGRHRVPSHHHQGIGRLGRNLTASAHARDGTIEAVELEGHPFALGVQWHPEADEGSGVVRNLVRAAERAREDARKIPATTPDARELRQQ